MLKGQLIVLPDNKIVEDGHNSIRRDAKANSNTRLSLSHMQELVMQSDVLESRGIRHQSRVKEQEITTSYRSTSGKSNGT